MSALNVQVTSAHQPQGGVLLHVQSLGEWAVEVSECWVHKPVHNSGKYYTLQCAYMQFLLLF